MSQPRVVDASGTPVPNSPMLLSSSNFGSPNVPGSDLVGMGTRSGSTTYEKLDALLSKFVHFETKIAQIPALTTWMSRMDSHTTKTVGFRDQTCRDGTEFQHPHCTCVQKSKQVQTQHQMFPVRHDSGL